MKLSCILPALLAASCEAFSVMPSAKQSASSTQLQAEMGRREMVATAAFTASALFVPVEAAFAEYVPKVDDMKQIYCK